MLGTVAVPELGGPGGGAGGEGLGEVQETEAWHAFLVQLPGPAAAGGGADQMEEDDEDDEDRDYSYEADQRLGRGQARYLVITPRGRPEAGARPGTLPSYHP